MFDTERCLNKVFGITGVYMEEIKPDRRIARTKKALANALLDLMEKKPIELITTTELCKAADINRNTFYVYYGSPADLLSEIEETLLEEMQKTLDRSPEKDVTREIFRIFAQNSRIYRILFSSSHSKLAEFTMDLCKERNIYKWRKTGIRKKKESELYFQFAAAGAGRLVMTWLENDCDMPAEELCSFIDQVSLYGLNALK